MSLSPQLDIPAGRQAVEGLNLKLLFDSFFLAGLTASLDNQRHARTLADIDVRRAQNAASFDHYVNMNAATAGQVGETEAQQTVSPAGTATSEAIKGGVGVSAEQVAANVANLGTTVNAAIAAVEAALAQLAQAVTAVIVTATGSASKPSETQAKPTT